MTWTQAYSLCEIAKMGTFPKSGEDHNNSVDTQLFRQQEGGK